MIPFWIWLQKCSGGCWEKGLNAPHNMLCYPHKARGWINLRSPWNSSTRSMWENRSHFSSTARLCLHWAGKESLLRWFTTLCRIRNLMQLGKIKFYVLQLKITCGELHTNKCTAVSISDKAVKWRMKANAKKMFWFNCLQKEPRCTHFRQTSALTGCDKQPLPHVCYT